MIPPPWALLAELTHACPLQCGYCSNPLQLVRPNAELTTDQWCEVMSQAGAMGVVQAHLSGGEPLLRPDLVPIAQAAWEAGIYTQLVTSGIGLTEQRLADLVAAGLGCVQLSVQHPDANANDAIAGRRSFADKQAAAAVIRAAALPFGLNVVLHRGNIDTLDRIVELALDWGADRVELANAQFYGWAQLNRRALLPTTAQLRRAAAQVHAWRDRLGSRLELVWVVPDHLDGTPKPCMGGWGAVSMTVAPDGTVLPCPAAASISTLKFENIRNLALKDIWSHSSAFAAYRGTDWLPSPCRDCSRKEEDFGGCRCQAFALTGDAARTDPACSLSPDHGLLRRVLGDTGDEAPVARSYRNAPGPRPTTERAPTS
ncbi:pyrroloquinoline quinone biosynthesis protein E [Actinacidiphila yanglinensis]|uniref:PqqA peptide cyclase n=2 Tax=Actinacidiphila yanglinensis TaxID=310779 RepID=A0A1H6DBU3_9ACTN|nr:pyrroloquinoline quinone biosynthesis protein E [Actinacidiphila yanglinensis]